MYTIDSGKEAAAWRTSRTQPLCNQMGQNREQDQHREPAYSTASGCGRLPNPAPSRSAVFKKLVTALVALLLGAYLWLAFIGVEPLDRRPGTLLSGTPAPLPQDLSLLADAMEVHLETRPWFGIPFSVTTVIASNDGRLYVPSLYEAAVPFPGTKYWNKVIARDPRVRLRVQDRLYAFKAEPVLEAAEFDQAFGALGRKYPFWQKKVEANNSAPKFALIRLTPRASQ